MSVLIALHAIGASLALLLGPVNLIRKPKGDRAHRRLGRVWVVAMYWTVVSSFFIHQINPGGFSWIHGLSAFTLITLSVGLWAARAGRITRHRGFMRGSYLGTVGAFIGAVVVPQRDIPQLAVHHPFLLSGAALTLGGLAFGIAALTRRAAPRPARTTARPATQPAGQPSGQTVADDAVSAAP